MIQTDLDLIPADLSGQYDCTFGNEPIMQHARGVVYGAQTPAGHFPLPKGVGYHFKTGQVVILQAHYLYPTHQPINAELHFGIDVGNAADIQQQAGYLFFYDPLIYVPAGGSFDVAARALRTGTGNVPLTKLEFGVMKYLDAHAGRAAAERLGTERR